MLLLLLLILLITIHKFFCVQFCRSSSFLIFCQLFSFSFSFLFRSTIDAFGTTASTLAQSLAEILAQSLGIESNFFRENCPPKSSYIRMNRYPKCPLASKVFGLVPHSDSNLLTILYQDQVGGLQLMKDGRWFKVKPNPKALIINIGDLFQVSLYVSA